MVSPIGMKLISGKARDGVHVLVIVLRVVDFGCIRFRKISDDAILQGMTCIC